MAPTFRERLEAVKEKGNLRDADLARWFDRRHSTVSGWLAGRSPAGPPGDIRDLFSLLVSLEEAISAKKLPLPRMSAVRRWNYLARLKHSARRNSAAKSVSIRQRKMT